MTTQSSTNLVFSSNGDGAATEASLAGILEALDPVSPAEIQITNDIYTADIIVASGGRQVTIINTGEGDLMIDGTAYPANTVFSEEAWDAAILPSYNVTVTAGNPQYTVRRAADA